MKQPPAPQPSPLQATSAAFAVVTNQFLLPSITQFQRGVPMLIHELTKMYDARSNTTISMPGMGDLPVAVVDAICSAGPVGRFWSSAMRCGDLAAVKLVSRMQSWPELRGHKDMRLKNLPVYAAICGRLDVIQWLHTDTQIERASAPWDGTMLTQTIAWGHFELARWLLANRPDACKEDLATAFESAAAQGQLLLLQELIAFSPETLTPEAMDAALRDAQWDVIRYLHEHSSVGCSSSGMDYAAWNGHLDVVQFLHGNRSEGCTTLAMDLAACRGHLEVVRYLHENRREGCTTDAMDMAVCCGHLNIIKFLHENRTEGCTTLAMNAAAASGRLNIVRYLHQNRSEGCTEEAFDNAAESGYQDVVNFLHSNCVVDTNEKGGDRGDINVVEDRTNVVNTLERVDIKNNVER